MFGPLPRHQVASGNRGGLLNSKCRAFTYTHYPVVTLGSNSAPALSPPSNHLLYSAFKELCPAFRGRMFKRLTPPFRSSGAGRTLHPHDLRLLKKVLLKSHCSMR